MHRPTGRAIASRCSLRSGTIVEGCVFAQAGVAWATPQPGGDAARVDAAPVDATPVDASRTGGQYQRTRRRRVVIMLNGRCERNFTLRLVLCLRVPWR